MNDVEDLEFETTPLSSTPQPVCSRSFIQTNLTLTTGKTGVQRDTDILLIFWRKYGNYAWNPQLKK